MLEIQDSDDELENLEADIPPQQQPVASAQEHGSKGSQQQHGTGSTGKISDGFSSFSYTYHYMQNR